MCREKQTRPFAPFARKLGRSRGCRALVVGGRARCPGRLPVYAGSGRPSVSSKLLPHPCTLSSVFSPCRGRRTRFGHRRTPPRQPSVGSLTPPRFLSRLRFASSPLRKIVPTVNSASPASVEKMLGHFLELMDLSSDRKRLDSYFLKRGSPDAGGDRAPPPRPGDSILSPREEKRRKETNGAKRGASTTAGMLQLFSKSRPCAADAAAGTTSGVSAASAAAKSSPTINLSGDAAVELNLGDVDVEAQKAIMADIERRRRGERQERDQDQAADRCVFAGVAAREVEETPRQAKTAGTNKKKEAKKQPLTSPTAAAGSGAKRRAVFGIGGAGETAEGSVGAEARARARAAAVAAPRPGEDFDRQRVLSVDDGGAELTSPMDIRDFFSKRG